MPQRCLARSATPEALWDSVKQRVFTLPDETLLFAGHERWALAVSTVLEQRRWQSRTGADVTLMECDSHEGFDDLEDATQQILMFLHPPPGRIRAGP